MRLINSKSDIDFMGKRNIALWVSAIVILACITSLATRGLNFGVDFTGGLLLEVAYEQSADLADIRQQLGQAGFDDAQAQNFGSTREVLIRMLPREDVESAKLGQQIP